MRVKDITMRLEKYIYEKRLTQEQAAEGIGISRQYLCDILNNKAIPGRAVAMKIMKWSDNMVRLNDMWGDF